GEQGEPGDAARGAVAHLGDAGDIRIVREGDVAAQPGLAEVLRGEVDPRVRHVRRRQGAAALVDRGEGDAERDVVVGDAERREDPLDGGQHVLRLRPLRGGDLDAIADQLTALEVDEAALDTRPADVDADGASRAP